MATSAFERRSSRHLPHSSRWMRAGSARSLCSFAQLTPHAYATRACPTLGWPLSSYKPGSPRALTCSPLRACQSCLPGARRLLRVAPISHLLCGLLALSSAPLLYSLHRLVSQSTRNMIDWLGFLFPCAFLYTTNSPVACGVRVCKLLPCSNKPCAPHVLLCSPHRACQSCLSDAWCVFLLPSRACAIRVCPTLGCSLFWIPHLGRINATRCEAVSDLRRCFWHSCLLSSVLAAPHRTCHACLPATYYVLLLPFPRASAICVCAKSHARCPSTSLVLLFPSLPCAPNTTFPSSIHVCATLGDPQKLLPWPSLFWPFEFPTCLRHACLPDAWLAFVFLQAWQPPRANLQPAARVPIVSARRLARLSLALPASLCPLYSPNVLFVSPQFHSYFAFPTCGCHSCL